jgi:DNA repair protein RadC
MENLSALPRETLVGELLSSSLPEGPGPVVADATRAYPLTVFPTAPCSAEAVMRKLAVARELLLRELRDQMQSSRVMDSPHVLREWLRLYCAGLEHEVFIGVFLDGRHRLIDAIELFRGTLSQTAVYPREVVKAALARNAAAIALAHNHPSGTAEPSRADEFLTQTLKSALLLVDVRVHDHFIVAGDRLVSFAERGLI